MCLLVDPQLVRLILLAFFRISTHNQLTIDSRIHVVYQNPLKYLVVPRRANHWWYTLLSMLWATLRQIPPKNNTTTWTWAKDTAYSLLCCMLLSGFLLQLLVDSKSRTSPCHYCNTHRAYSTWVSFRNRAHLHHSNQTVTYLLQQARMASTSETEQPKPAMTIPKAISLIKHKHSVSVLVDVRWFVQLCVYFMANHHWYVHSAHTHITHAVWDGRKTCQSPSKNCSQQQKWICILTYTRFMRSESRIALQH